MRVEGFVTSYRPSAAKAAGLSRQAVYRIQADPAGAEATLAIWGRSEKSK